MKAKKVFPFMVVAMLAVSSFVACNKYKQDDVRHIQISESKHNTKSLSAPCAPTTGSIPVSITPQNLDAVINQYAALHNDYLNYYFASLTSQTLTFPSSQYDEHFRNTASSYFQSHSVLVNTDYYQCVQSSNPDIDLVQYRSSFSSSGVIIYDQLCNLVDAYDVANHNQFVLNLNNLYANCNTLAFNEQVRLKFAIKIAIHSFTYWKDNGEEWITYYEDNYSTAAGNQQKASNAERNKRILSNAGKADLGGALRGAIGGGLGAGPAGAVAGALVVGGASSAASIVWDAIFG
jgi:hypothetical protein